MGKRQRRNGGEKLVCLSRKLFRSRCAVELEKGWGDLIASKEEGKRRGKTTLRRAAGRAAGTRTAREGAPLELLRQRQSCLKREISFEHFEVGELSTRPPLQ